MKLYYTPTSPFVRKVLVAAHETGLASRIETVFLRPSPLEANPELSLANPLSKIPALVFDDGSAIYDSAVICDYLDSLHTGRKLVAVAGSERWRTLRLQALCDGIIEACVQIFYERLNRPKELWWQPGLDGQAQKAHQALDALEAEVDSLGKQVTLGHVCVGVTVGWLEFRDVLGDIRKGRPRLSAWYDAFAVRPSMQATMPHL